ncbi:MAG TPA: hypothetical protein VKC56_12515 [Gallionellaceae bacterium]|nr:hypothetical protein [Gallionellaceae bacterium]
MEDFDRSMAIDMLEDALQAVADPVGRGIATGLCSAFYLCGIIESADWEDYHQRILMGSHAVDAPPPAVPSRRARSSPAPATPATN